MESTPEKTRYHTKVVSKNQFSSMMISCAENFVDFFGRSKRYDVDLFPVNISDGFEFINFVAIKNSWPEFIRKLYMQCYVSAEKNKRCSGVIAAYVFSRLILQENYIKNDYDKNDIYAIKCRKVDALKSLNFFIDDNIFDFIKNVIVEVGVFGSVSIENTKSSIPTLEFSAGHTFNVGLHQHFAIENINVSNTKLLLFDGAIQEVSQVDHLFTQASEKKCKIIVVARSFANDILSTINVNFKRNTLNVFPIVVTDEISNINSFFDISTCTGADVITAESGKRLSNVNIEDLKDVNDVTLTKTKINFESNPLQKEAITKRIDAINQKIDHACWEDNMSEEDIRIVYTSRIDSLSGNLIKLWIPGSKEFLNYVRRNFDFSINYISSFSNFGKFKTSNVCKDSFLPKNIPPDIFEISVLTGKKMYGDIKSVGCCIELE